MNDLVKFSGGGLPQNPSDLMEGLQHVSAGLSGRSGGMPLLRLLRDGVYAYGQENVEPQEGSEWAVNPHSFQHGFACWGDGELLGEAMVPLNQPPPNVNELQDFGEPWAQQISFQLQCLNGEDTGVTVLYKSTSVGYLNMAKALIDHVVLQLQHDPANYVPVVALDTDSYNHKQYGKIYFPVLDVLRFIPIEGDTQDVGQTELTDETKEKPAAKEQKKAESAKSRRKAKREPVADAHAEADEASDATEGEAAENAEPANQTRRRRRRAS